MRETVGVKAETSERKPEKKDRATGPTFTFRYALPERMTPSEARLRCEQFIRALADRSERGER